MHSYTLMTSIQWEQRVNCFPNSNFCDIKKLLHPSVQVRTINFIIPEVDFKSRYEFSSYDIIESLFNNEK